jgi:putative DNA primase/helicase
MVEPRPPSLAQAPPALLDCIFRRGKWARGVASSPADVSDAPAPAMSRSDAAPRDEAIRRYALAALDNEVKKVEQAGTGVRNQTLNNAALALGHLVAAGALPEAVVRQVLEDAARICGLDKDDGIASVRSTIKSGLRTGMGQATDLSKIGRRAHPRRPSGQAISGSGSGGGDADAAGTLDRKLAMFKLTDMGNVERFLSRFGDEFKWSPAIGWLAWDQKRWSAIGAEGLANIAAHDTVRAIEAESAAIQGTALDYEIETSRGPKKYSAMVAAWGVTSQGFGHFRGLVGAAAAYQQVEAVALDADPMKFNVNNGTLIARKTDDGSDYITLRPHNRADLITKLAPVEYDPAAICPRYDEFMSKVQPDAAYQRFLHQWGGLGLTGDVSEEKLAIFYGTGQNGKSTWLESVARVAGEYGRACMIETFLEQKSTRRGDQATPDLARLAGARFLRTSEPERGAKLAEAFIKVVTGGDTILARHLNKEAFEFRPQFKLTISGNYKPRIIGSDDGIWRRIRLVEWKVKIPEAERDPLLKPKLAAEYSGILNRLLDGLRDWLDHGLIAPDGVIAATAAYRTDSDPLGRFLAACTRAAPEKRVQSSKLLEVFLAWGKRNGVNEWSQATFANAMAEHGYEKLHSNVIWWLDLELTREVKDFQENQEDTRD